MRYKYLLLLSILYVSPLSAQRWEVFGAIRSSTGEIVPGASVYINDSTGVVSNESGYYKIVSNTRPTELVVQHLSHFSRRIPLQSEVFEQQRLQLDVLLTAQFVALPAVDIVSAKVQTLIEEDFTTDILDYDFAGENMLLLLRERNRYLLRMVDESGKVLSEKNLAGSPCRLFRSCTGGLHIVNPDFAQELIINVLELDTFPRYNARKFMDVIEPCVLKNDRYYVYSKATMLNQAIRFWYYDAYGGQHYLTDIWNKAAIEEVNSAYRGLTSKSPFATRPESTSYSQPINQDFDVDILPASYDMPLDVAQMTSYAESSDQVAWLGALKTIENDAAYAPVFKMGERIYIFDHVNGEIRQFDDLFRREKTIPIHYHQEKGWKKELLKDDITNVVYAHLAPKGRHQLQRLDLDSGTIEKSYPLDEVMYLSHHFKIRDGYLYYLGQTDVNIPNYKLLKVNIAQQRKQ